MFLEVVGYRPTSSFMFLKPLRARRCGQPSYPIDVAVALDHISLVAVELELELAGLGLSTKRR